MGLWIITDINLQISSQGNTNPFGEIMDKDELDKAGFNMKCTVYKVDPNYLASGIPVENLPRQNECVIEKDNKVINAGEFQNTGHLYKKDEPPIPKPKKNPGYPEIKMSDRLYKQVINGHLIKVSGGKVGQIYKIVNENTGSFIIRQLQSVSGDKKYFAGVY